MEVTLQKQSFSGGSFHGVYLLSSIKELTTVLGKPQTFDNDGTGKVNVTWYCITDCGVLFRIYDWKEYRTLDKDEKINFHIGGYSFVETHHACNKVLKMIRAEREGDIYIEPDTLKAINELRDIYLTQD